MASTSGNLSFYTDAEAFDRFHKDTSYYQTLQRQVTRILRPNPGQLVMELGSATGATTRRVASTYPEAQVVGLDFRADIVAEATRLSPTSDYPNLSFATADMAEVSAYIPWQGRYPDIIYSLFAFHHIPDPVANKYAFAETLYNLPVERLKVVVADEITQYSGEDERYGPAVIAQWDDVAKEAYRSVYVNSYLEMIENEVDPTEAQERAVLAASYTRDVELTIGQTTSRRDDEYPVCKEEMLDIWLSAGFHVTFHAPISRMLDMIFVFEK